MRPQTVTVPDPHEQVGGANQSLALPSLEAPRAAIMDEPEGYEGVWDTIGMNELLDAMDDSRGG